MKHQDMLMHSLATESVTGPRLVKREAYTDMRKPAPFYRAGS